jgi:hypothetical protein
MYRTLLKSWPLAALTVLGCGSEPVHPDRAFGPVVATDAALHLVRIHAPEGLGELTVEVGQMTQLARVECVTCHGAGLHGATLAAEGTEGEPVHGDVKLAHGALTCESCHSPGDRATLRLANGDKLAFADAMTLCAQCHGVQTRDWRRGSHGGMNGYWDLRRGERVRNHCVDCHDPHAPAYKPVRAVFPPRDRYLKSQPEAH